MSTWPLFSWFHENGTHTASAPRPLCSPLSATCVCTVFMKKKPKRKKKKERKKIKERELKKKQIKKEMS